MMTSHCLQHPLIIATFRQGIVTVGFGLLIVFVYYDFISSATIILNVAFLVFFYFRQLLPVHESLQTKGLGGRGVVQFKQDDRKWRGPLPMHSIYTVKKASSFPFPSRDVTYQSLWPVIIKLFPGRESFVSDISAGDRKITNLFFTV